VFKNYFKTAFRNLMRHRNYAILNIAGLAAGISICLLIFIVIRFESSFDNFHSRKDRIYRVLTEYHHAGAAEIFYGRGVPVPMPEALRTSFPQIEKVATIYTEENDQILVLNENAQSEKKFKEEKGVFLTDPSFFDIFDYPMLAGDATTALKNPNSAVLTKEIAEKYFGDWTIAMGKNIKWNNRDILRVTGIMQTIPNNTDLPLKVLISIGTGYSADFKKSTNWDGTGTSYGCYVLAKPNLNLESFNAQLRGFAKKMKSPENKDSHIIQPLSKVHFDTRVGNYGGKTISPELIRALWLIATFILLIACVNFINLSTAQAANRAKEVGVRKVLGGNNRQLKTQFITETLLIVLIAVLLASAIGIFSLPSVSKILDLPLSFDILQHPGIILFLSIITIVVTLLAGFYPSLVLSRFNPINALKSKLSTTNPKGISLRRGLVVFQFVVAQALIIGTLITVKQMNYFNRRPLGFDKDAIVNVPFPADSAGISKLNYLRKQLSDVRGVQKISFSSNTPVEDEIDNWTKFRFDHAAKEIEFYVVQKWTDHEYLPTYRLPLVAGRNLTASDTAREFLVNETLIKNLGITDAEDALNKEINLWDGFVKGPIVGVLKDFHDRSFRREFAPVLMTTLKGGYSSAGIKLTLEHVPSTIQSISNIWETTFPDFVFEYQFLDAKIDSFYKEENQLSQLYKIFAAIAIFLSCLGLYGLASFMAVQRIKEVGIRKVLGATAGNIVYLFSREFVILIGIAFVIATPISWYFMQQWLQDYVFRIDISWWIFLLGGMASIIIALATVSYQAIKAAVANPVKSLRTE
jgi:putative ABC transport system permease protein